MTPLNQSPTTAPLLGEPKYIPIGSLRLDALNPRLPQSYRTASQDDLAVLLELGFEAYAVAQSISDNGYFQSEPLLVVASDTEENCWVVVEGNRRLTALIGLTDPKVRSQFGEAEKWEQLAGRCPLSSNDPVPVVVHPNRESTHREVGKAHVVGKLSWRPYAQAVYVAARVAEGGTYAEVAEMLGMSKSKVADMYRDQAIVRQAQETGLDTTEVERAFAVLTVAMGSTKLRNHVGASLGSQLDPGKQPIPDEKVPELKELIGWIFGTDDKEPVISDSRQITQLGNVVASEVGLSALRGGDRLDQAKQKIDAQGMPPLERLSKRLTTALNALSQASDDIGDHCGDTSIRNLIDDIEAVLEGLRSIIEDGQNLVEDRPGA
jgi:hypothetical protein